MFIPYYNGNVWVASKIDFLKEEQISPDLLFIGSSQTYRHVDPDEVKRNFTDPETLFNLGAPATFCPQTYYLVNNILNDVSISKDLEYLVVELNPISLIENSIMTQERAYYWLNFSEYLFVERAIWKQNGFRLLAKIRYTVNFTKAFVFNFLNLGQYSDQVMSESYLNPKYLGLKKNGFLPLESDMKMSEDLSYTSALDSRRADLASNPKILDTRRLHSVDIENNQTLVANKVHFERLQSIIAKCKKVGIEVVFLLPPRISSERSRALFNMLDDKNKIDMNSGTSHPEFYNLELSFDKGHLNNEGARLYSLELGIRLAEKFK